jgi:hypothetical protein
MRIRFEIAFLVLLLGVTILPATTLTRALQVSETIRIFGLVDNPLNLTRAELASFPMVSEVARLKCVVGIPDVVYNWTGIPLFHLLALAQIKPEAYKIVTRAYGFESDLLVKEAIKPNVILAVGANGTSLPNIDGIQGAFRLVVPCKWGYKWVGDVKEIEVVDTDYKGTYEGSGWDDAGDIADCGPLPTLTPPIQTSTLPYGNRSFEIGIFTNAQVKQFAFNYFQNEITTNFEAQQETMGFADFIIPESFLKGPYNVTIDGNKVATVSANIIQHAYIYIAFSQGNHTVNILGTEFFGKIPQISVDYNNTAYIEETITFDASKSTDYIGIVSFEWSFGDGANGTGAVTQHSYAKEGIYSVKLNATNSDDISNFATLTVYVGTRPVDVLLFVKAFLIALFGLLVLMLALLLRNRKPTTQTSRN